MPADILLHVELKRLDRSVLFSFMSILAASRLDAGGHMRGNKTCMQTLEALEQLCCLLPAQTRRQRH